MVRPPAPVRPGLLHALFVVRDGWMLGPAALAAVAVIAASGVIAAFGEVSEWAGPRNG